MNALPLALLVAQHVAPGSTPSLEEHVDAGLDAALARSTPVGATLTAALGPEDEIRSRGAGSLDANGAWPATGATRMHGPEVAELVTQVLVCDLVAHGELAPDASIASLVPELSGLDPNILVATALQGRSGLRDVRDVFHVRRKGERASASIMDAAVWAAHTVRKHGRATVSDTALLAAVLEHVEGRPLADVARERLFRPLGMDSTGYRLQPALGHALRFTWPLSDDPSPVPPHGRVYAFEGLYTTAPDPCRLSHGLTAPRVLHADAVDALVAATKSGLAGRTSRGSTPAGRRTIEWYGRDQTAALAVVPDPGWGMACLDARTPGRAWKGVQAAMIHVDRILDPDRPPSGLLGIGGGAGGRYGRSYDPLRAYGTDELVGSFDVVELDLELTISAEGDRGFGLTLEGWPRLRSTGRLVGDGPPGSGKAVQFASTDRTLRARLEVRIESGDRLFPTSLSLDGEFQRHGTLDRLRIRRLSPRER